MSENPSTTRRRNHGVVSGLMLTFVSAVTYFTVFSRFPALRDFPWLNLPLIVVGVGVSLFAVWRAFAMPDVYRGKILGSLSLLLSAAIAGLFVFYIFIMTGWLPEQSPAGQVVARLPEFSLTDHLDRPVQSADLRGKKVVLTFFRGHW